MFIHGTLERARRVYPAKEAVIHGHRRFTHAQLGDRADRLAGALVPAGVGPGARVGVLLQNRHE